MNDVEHLKKILLVEDDRQDVELILAALKECGLASQVAVVRDGEKALDYLYRRGEFRSRAGDNPRLVLLDLKMPKVNVLEVLQAIKEDENLQSIPVVVLSSSRETRDLVECYRQGVNAYVVKPVEFAEFRKAIQHLGIFWATINEPPPNPKKRDTNGQNGSVPTRGTEGNADEFTALNLTLLR